MNNTNSSLKGLASSLFLNVGLTGLAESLDAVSQGKIETAAPACATAISAPCHFPAAAVSAPCQFTARNQG